MSALIKSGSSGAVRLIGELPREPAPVQTLRESDPRDVELARLHAEVSRLAAALDSAGAEAAVAIEDARKEGLRAGRAEAEDREEARVAALRAGVDEAVAAMRSELASIELLAPQMVRAALGTLLDAPDEWAPLVMAALKRQLATLDRAVSISVSVSSADFTQAPDMGGEIGVTLDSALAPGSAVLRSGLNRFDIDLPAQWQTLAALLDRMSDGVRP